MRTKWLAVIAAAGLLGATACGSSDDPTPPSSSERPTEFTDLREVGTYGLQALDECSNESDAAMYACDHYKFIQITEMMAAIPEESRDIRNVMGTFQTSYTKYWAPRMCGTSESTDTTGLMCNRSSLEMVLTQARDGFQRMADTGSL